MMQATVAELHAFDPFAGEPVRQPTVLWCRPTDSALVLGSRQSLDVVDVDRCHQSGLSLVRRRSGGGAVVVAADSMMWIDLVLPHGTVPDDVRASMEWAGECWTEALTALSRSPSLLSVHRQSMVITAWSDLVCFAGLGPGEVLLDGRKLVGLSQRRTRAGIRIQGAMHVVAPVVDVARLFVGPTPTIPVPVPAFVPVADPELLVGHLEECVRG
jgi:lipoate---protein ligase